MSESAIRAETSQVLLEFWQELLDVDTVKPDNRLLELGGNSLIATMIANRVELIWGFRPTLEELLTDTFAELTAFCEQRRLAE